MHGSVRGVLGNRHPYRDCHPARSIVSSPRGTGFSLFVGFFSGLWQPAADCQSALNREWQRVDKVLRLTVNADAGIACRRRGGARILRFSTAPVMVMMMVSL